MMKEIIEIKQSTCNPERGWYIRKKYHGSKTVKFLWKDLTWHSGTGYGEYVGLAPGYYKSRREALFTLNWFLEKESRKIQNLAIAYGMGQKRLKEFSERGQNMSMIRLSNGVEISEDTVVSALKKSGISVKPKPKHIFEAGDVAKHPYLGLRIILNIGEKLKSFDQDGCYLSTGQEEFDNESYKYVGKLRDLLKS